MKSMKDKMRLLALFAVALTLVLAGTVPAFAVWGDTTYSIWRDTSNVGSNIATQSPHGEYDTSSQKCKVCHAVHNARPGNELLLKSAVIDSCAYCHIDGKVSDYVVYDGDRRNYTGNDFQNAHNANYGESGAKCQDCHSVHAASTLMTNNEYLTDKILSGAKDNPFFDRKYDLLAGAPQALATDNQHTAISKWCTKCHRSANYNYYLTNYADGSQTHIMKEPSLYSRGGMSTEPTMVAYAGSSQCSSCHTSQYNDGTHSWPHYTDGARFLTSGDNNAGSYPTPVNQTRYDGVCLRCHREGSRGVGLTW